VKIHIVVFWVITAWSETTTNFNQDNLWPDRGSNQEPKAYPPERTYSMKIQLDFLEGWKYTLRASVRQEIYL
jgi:hypothetical protein